MVVAFSFFDQSNIVFTGLREKRSGNRANNRNEVKIWANEKQTKRKNRKSKLSRRDEWCPDLGDVSRDVSVVEK